MAAGQIDENEPFDPVDPTDIGATSGIFYGTAIALVLLGERGGLANPHSWRVRLLRFLVGFVSVVIALVVVGAVGGATGLADEIGFAGSAWQFVSLFAVALVIFYAVPRAFGVLSLAPKG